MNRSIKVVPFPEIENAYIVISGVKSERGNGCLKRLSFFYGTKEGGCEWEPEYGPITRIVPCKKDNEDAQEHWFYDYCTGYGNWSQLAVGREMLTEHFLSGDYKYLFSVLKSWSE